MRFRSMTATLLCAAVCIGVCGCFDTPLGDPQKSSIDPNLEGFYEATGDNGDTQMAELSRFDDHVYLLQVFKFFTDVNGVHIDGYSAMKAWVTTIKGTQFITIQVTDPMDLFKPADQRKATYVIGALVSNDKEIELRTLSEAKFTRYTTPGALAQAVSDNMGQPGMYEDGDKQVWTRMTDRDQVQAVMKAANPQ